jgi:hypothetical protein
MRIALLGNYRYTSSYLLSSLLGNGRDSARSVRINMNGKSNSLTPSSDFKNEYEIQITMLPTLCLLSWNGAIDEERSVQWDGETKV